MKISGPPAEAAAHAKVVSPEEQTAFLKAHKKSLESDGKAGKRADLTGANLLKAWLPEANLQGSSLQRANLHEANLQGANLQGANLQGANLREANLRRADLWGADLRGAKLRGAKLTEVVGLTQEQIKSAITDEKTKLPEGLRPSK